MMEKLVIFVTGLAVAAALYLIVVILPVIFYTEAECLRNGFPKSHVTVGLERYCSALDGQAVVKLSK